MKHRLFRNATAPFFRGFTLVELMIAAIATVTILSAAGYGLIAILYSRNAADASITQRQSLNRALNYITDEVRMANAIDTSGNTASVTGFTLPTGAQSVLVLNIPYNNSSFKVVYYIAPSASPWLAPNNIVRYGPDLNSDGTYNTASFNAYTLVDSINTADVSSICTLSSSSIVPSSSRQGFSACIRSDGKAADLFLGSTFTDTAGKSSAYTVTSRAVARSK